jgi:exoribonuclease R
MCSLKPAVDRLALGVRICRFHLTGEVKHYEFMEAVFHLWAARCTMANLNVATRIYSMKRIMVLRPAIFRI